MLDMPESIMRSSKGKVQVILSQSTFEQLGLSAINISVSDLMFYFLFCMTTEAPSMYIKKNHAF